MLFCIFHSRFFVNNAICLASYQLFFHEKCDVVNVALCEGLINEAQIYPSVLSFLGRMKGEGKRERERDGGDG